MYEVYGLYDYKVSHTPSLSQFDGFYHLLQEGLSLSFFPLFSLRFFFDNFPLNLFQIGWQPGIQVGAADWDEDWDKFEEEGMQKSLY